MNHLMACFLISIHAPNCRRFRAFAGRGPQALREFLTPAKLGGSVETRVMEARGTGGQPQGRRPWGGRDAPRQSIPAAVSSL